MTPLTAPSAAKLLDRIAGRYYDESGVSFAAEGHEEGWEVSVSYTADLDRAGNQARSVTLLDGLSEAEARYCVEHFEARRAEKVAVWKAREAAYEAEREAKHQAEAEQARQLPCNCARRGAYQGEVSVFLCNYHGDPGLARCGRCNGRGQHSGETRDDPAVVPCAYCDASGVADTKRFGHDKLWAVVKAREAQREAEAGAGAGAGAGTGAQAGSGA